MRPTLIGAVLAGTLLCQPLGASAAVGRPGSALGDAQARAHQLRLTVDELQKKAELATEAYDAAYSRLGRAVSAHLSAQEQLDAATAGLASAGNTADLRVRALYMSGGVTALYATLLQGSGLPDVLDRLRSVRAVVDGDRTVSLAHEASVAARRAAVARLSTLADEQIRLQAAVASKADEVRSLLDQTTALLAQADAEVRALAEAERAAAARAAAASAAAALARAQALAGLPGGINAPPSTAAGAVIAAAETHLGQPYLWGGTGPAAYDCSGLTQAAFRAAGIALPRTAAEQYFAGPPVALGDIAPGDLLFWATDPTNAGTIEHVAIYLGGGQMLAAPHTGAFVRVEPVYLNGFFGAARPTASWTDPHGHT